MSSLPFIARAPLLVLSAPPLSATPSSVKLPASVRFTSTLLDTSAPPGGSNRRLLTLRLEPGNDLTFENGGKSISDFASIASTPTNVALNHTISGTGGTNLGFNVSQFDETGAHLGSVVVGLL